LSERSNTTLARTFALQQLNGTDRLALWSFFFSPIAFAGERIQHCFIIIIIIDCEKGSRDTHFCFTSYKTLIFSVSFRGVS